MAPINTKNVHRTNFLLGHPWGDDLVYDEMVMTTIGDAGKAMAEAMAKANPSTPASSPATARARKSARTAFTTSSSSANIPTAPRCAPAFRATATPAMVRRRRCSPKTGIALLENEGAGGVWTPGALLGDALIERLTANAGLTFQIEE